MPKTDLQDLTAYFKKKLGQLKEWMKPVPSDHVVMQVVKSILKFIVLLLLIALSPVLIVVMIFVFFAAL